MILSVHQPQYIPWLGYFDKIAKSDCFVFLDQVQYKEREFQNRNKIRTKLGALWLSVPVVSKGLGRQKICDVKIDNNLNWRNKHWRSLTSNYNKAHFFKDYCGFFESLYNDTWDKLMDLDIYVIKYLLKELAIETPLYYESEVGTTALATDRIIELCVKLKADTYLTGMGGKNYLQEEKFSQANIKLVYQHFEHPEYQQQYMEQDKPFMPFMSSIDLLFNQGKKSVDILRGRIENV